MKKKIIYILCALVGITNQSCSYLDVVPDNMPSIEQIFDTREGAWQMLQTCYDYVPTPANICENPALLCGDEIINPTYDDPNFYYYRNKSTDFIAAGKQSAILPLLDYWDGANYDYLNQVWGDFNQVGNNKSLWAGIRQCNILIDEIDRVPSMKEDEKSQWKAECYVLKAYYHYYLLQMYGPIPYMDENIPVSASPDVTQREREPVDVVVSKIVEDLDIAINSGGLPATYVGKTNDLGRINLPIAKAIKAKVLVLAASPLFNGNTKYPNYLTLAGEPFFNPEYSEEKWSVAADACIDAINACKDASLKLFEFDQEVYGLSVSEETQLELTLRDQITENKNNTELVWGIGRQNVGTLVQHAGTPLNKDHNAFYYAFNNLYGPTMNAVDDFYSNNGVPIDEDNTYDYANRYDLTTVPDDQKIYFTDEADVKVPIYNTHREPRFYAYLGFDQGRYYCQEITDDTKSYVIKSKAKDFAGVSSRMLLAARTGYTCKKIVPWRRQLIINQLNNLGEVLYFFPIIRMSDLYLMCAESLNEAGRDKTEVLNYLQPIRTKAGLDIETGGIEQTWATYSKYPSKLSTKEGMRDVIRQERRVELAFEGQRYWDIKRWGEAELYFNKPIRGWYVYGNTDLDYYQVSTVAYRSFSVKDYFWPIKQTSVDINAKLVQSPGW